jgi:methylmalonyl-CoA mutase
LRDAADAFAARTGTPPRIFLANLGDLSVYSTRASWMRNFLAAGGIEVIASEPLHNSTDAGRAFADSGVAIACICSADTVYAELAEATAGALKQAGARQVLLAGRPKAQEAALKSADVDRFIYAGVDAIAVLTALHEALDVRD